MLVNCARLKQFYHLLSLFNLFHPTSNVFSSDKKRKKWIQTWKPFPWCHFTTVIPTSCVEERQELQKIVGCKLHSLLLRFIPMFIFFSSTRVKVSFLSTLSYCAGWKEKDQWKNDSFILLLSLPSLLPYLTLNIHLVPFLYWHLNLFPSSYWWSWYFCSKSRLKNTFSLVLSFSLQKFNPTTISFDLLPSLSRQTIREQLMTKVTSTITVWID